LPAQGRLESLSYEDSQEDGFAREMRARQLLKHKSDVVLSVAHIKAMMRAHAGRNPITFGCLQSTDDASYVNRALANPLLVLGVATGSADVARYGTIDDAYNWAEDEDLRADAKARIEHWRCEAQWTHTRLELSGARGQEAPPYSTAVYGHRWLLEVTVPPSDSAAKRRRFSAVHVAPRTRPRRGAAPGPPTAGTPGSDASQN
jgi:hypothetical protein